MQGVRQIIRFNWPFYAASAAVIVGSAAVLRAFPAATGLRPVAAAAIAIALFWSAASLVASYWVYDRSELTAWTWLRDELGPSPRRWLNVHAGFDQTTRALEEIFPAEHRATWDIYRPDRMTEPSIRRARETQGLPGQAPSEPPTLEEGPWDACFLIFAAHELRRPEDRRGIFSDLRRRLAPGGHLVLVEHVRDLANAIAYGPGALHFFPAGEWRSAARDSGFSVCRERRMTPFVRFFLLAPRDDAQLR
jgi:SAM-dependent methyltransferase